MLHPADYSQGSPRQSTDHLLVHGHDGGYPQSTPRELSASRRGLHSASTAIELSAVTSLGGGSTHPTGTYPSPPPIMSDSTTHAQTPAAHTPAQHTKPVTPRAATAAAYQPPPRRNGWQRPFDSQQQLVWAAGLISLAIFFGLVLPFVRGSELVAYVVVYLGILVLVLPCYVVTQHIDPILTSDMAVPYAQPKQSVDTKNPALPTSASNSIPQARMCEKCSLWMGPRTKHCHLCRKCIHDFDHHCFDGETPVTMADRTTKLIKHVRVGDQVLAYSRAANGKLVPRMVTAVTKTPDRACIKLTFLDGRTLICTPDHRLLRADGTWCAAEDLPLGSSVRAAKSTTSQLFTLPLCERRVIEARDVYDLTVPVAPTSDCHAHSTEFHALQEAEASFVANGVVVHNCLYLNTCIGGRNYSYFLITIVGTTLALALQIGVTVSLLVRAGMDDEVIVRNINESALNRTGYIALLAILSFVPLLFFCLIASLVGFHCMILLKGQTTYEWIMAGRKKRADAEAEAAEREARERRAGATSPLSTGSAVSMSGPPSKYALEQARIEAEWKAEREKERRRRAGTNSTGSGGGSATPSRFTSMAASPAVARTKANTKLLALPGGRSPSHRISATPARASVADDVTNGVEIVTLEAANTTDGGTPAAAATTTTTTTSAAVAAANTILTPTPRSIAISLRDVPMLDVHAAAAAIAGAATTSHALDSAPVSAFHTNRAFETSPTITSRDFHSQTSTIYFHPSPSLTGTTIAGSSGSAPAPSSHLLTVPDGGSSRMSPITRDRLLEQNRVADDEEIAELSVNPFLLQMAQQHRGSFTALSGGSARMSARGLDSVDENDGTLLLPVPPDLTPYSASAPKPSAAPVHLHSQPPTTERALSAARVSINLPADADDDDQQQHRAITELHEIKTSQT